MDTEGVPQRPEREFEDQSREAAKIALSAVPVVGGAAAAVFESIFRSPLEQRKNKWLDALADAIRKLQEKVGAIDAESLRDNETFVTIATQATQIALRNHQAEKLEALRNAVLNSPLPNAPDEDTQMIFLNLVDSLTPTHVRLLRLFDDPQGHAEEKSISYDNAITGSLSQLIEDVFPELQGRRDFYNQVVRDLHASGLSGASDTGVMISGSGMLGRRTTTWARQFIQFISDPPELGQE